MKKYEPDFNHIIEVKQIGGVIPMTLVVDRRIPDGTMYLVNQRNEIVSEVINIDIQGNVVAGATPTNTQRLSFLQSLWKWVISKNDSHL